MTPGVMWNNGGWKPGGSGTDGAWYWKLDQATYLVYPPFRLYPPRNCIKSPTGGLGCGGAGL